MILTMQDLWIHGHTDRGVIGAIGGVVSCLRCDIAYNGMAGWDFDDGQADPERQWCLELQLLHD
jgi:hypothetical protein